MGGVTGLMEYAGVHGPVHTSTHHRLLTRAAVVPGLASVMPLFGPWISHTARVISHAHKISGTRQNMVCLWKRGEMDGSIFG